MGLLILLYPFAEIYTFYRFIVAYSFFDALLLVVMSGIVGGLIIRLLGPATLALLQNDLTQGKLPTNQILHRALVIIGGIFLLIPGILSDIVGALFILPGTRHLIALYVKSLVQRGLFKGRVFVGGLGGFGRPGGFRGGAGPGPGGFSRHHRPSDWEEPRHERDAQVVDVEPLEITHKNLPPGENGGSQS